MTMIFHGGQSNTFWKNWTGGYKWSSWGIHLKMRAWCGNDVFRHKFTTSFSFFYFSNTNSQETMKTSNNSKHSITHSDIVLMTKIPVPLVKVISLDVIRVSYIGALACYFNPPGKKSKCWKNRFPWESSPPLKCCNILTVLILVFFWFDKTRRNCVFLREAFSLANCYIS